MFTIGFDTPAGHKEEVHDDVLSARAALIVAIRRFTNVTVNGNPVTVAGK